MFKTKLVALTGILLLLNGCAGQSYKLAQTEQVNTAESKKLNDRSIEYRILPQDRLEVALYKDPARDSQSNNNELGQSMNERGILVDTQGYVILPLIGKIKVSGFSQSEAAARITEQYKKYLNTPSVYLEVLNKRIFVLGEVNKPGVVNLDKEKMTLFEAIAFSGDLTDSAVRDNVIILSNDVEQGMQMRSVDLTNFDTMRYASLMLRPNDIVYVQPDGWKEFKIASDNFTAPFETVAKIAAPFVTIKYLAD
ncbi:polysaccharide biosynthesis/export family protein [Sulfurovum sp.]|uniref:polysaccharide biosynthesis/export family protein n=1 Tax=Sulfurovum sp. TaxID=1969726 RepID=UPI002867B628|nr:polysaccharide biosynthesis/export family protein [Sulfurovum sp.]